MQTHPGWIDTHCHLDAPEFAADLNGVRQRAAQRGVRLCVIPAVDVNGFDRVRALAHRFGDAYALGIHPLCVKDADDAALSRLDAALHACAGDPRLVAVGEIGLDYFVPELKEGALYERQMRFFRAQLQLASAHRLPVLLHSRRAVDDVIHQLRLARAPGGIAHAFNGSQVQAAQFLRLGFRLGFGGAVTYERATRLRRLAAQLDPGAIVMETDAPDIPPQWLYTTAAQRAAGAAQAANEPGELRRIGAEIAHLRTITADAWATITTANALDALPGLRGLLL